MAEWFLLRHESSSFGKRAGHVALSCPEVDIATWQSGKSKTSFIHQIVSLYISLSVLCFQEVVTQR